MALRVDLNDQLHRDAFVLLELDQPVEELLPQPIAGHVVVGDEERIDALPMVLAHDLLEIVCCAESTLAALHVDDGAERTLERTAAPEVEARAATFVARQRIGRKTWR